MPICKHLKPVEACPDCGTVRALWRLPLYLAAVLLACGAFMFALWPPRQTEFPTIRIVRLTNQVYRDLVATNTIFYVPATMEKVVLNNLTVWQSEGFGDSDNPYAALYIASTNIKVYANSIARLCLDQ